MEDRMAALRQRFVDRCRDDLAALEQGDGPERTIEIVHRLSGSAGIFGFSRISEVAEQTETALRDGTPNEELMARLLDALRAVQRV